MPDQPIDVFLSYTHQNDHPPPGARIGWVTMLKQHLEAALCLKLPRPGPRLFQDHQLLEGTSFERQLLEKVRSARTLVLVLSPAYVDSPWCKRELANFLVANDRSGAVDNVFVVEIEQIDPRRIPARLGEFLALRFWQEDPDSRVRETLGYPAATAQDREYIRLVNRLAHRITERLAEGPAGAAAADPKSVVYIAETTDELAKARGEIVEYVESQGARVVPAGALPRDCETAFVDTMVGELGRASLYVQLLGLEEGPSPPDGRVSYTRLQAGAAFKDEAGLRLRVLQWRDPNLAQDRVGDLAYRELLFGRHVQASRLEEFKLEVLRALGVESRPDSPKDSGASAARRNGSVKMFVKADGVDHDVGEKVSEILKALDVVPELSQPSDGRGGFAQTLGAEVSRIAACDAVMFVYGNSTPSWLNATYLYTARAMGLRREGIWGAVLDTPSQNKRAVPVKSRNLVTLDCRGGIQPEVLKTFIDAVRLQRAAGA